MDFDIMRASGRLSELDLKITTGNLGINILWFRVMQCGSDTVIKRHTHSSFEFHFVYAGSSRVVLDKGAFEVGAGEFYLTLPGVHHRQEIPAGYIEFSLNCEFSAINEHSAETRHIVDILKNAECRPYKDIAGASGLFYDALREAYFQNTGFYSNISALTLMLVSAAARAIGGLSQADYAVPLKQKKDGYRFIQIQDYIRSNIGLPLSTADVARYMFLSEKQVARIVSEACGMTTKKLVQDLKFRKAKELLVERQDLSVRQISEMLGFSSEYYFNQFFKRKEGYPPGAFRFNVRIS